MLGFSAISLASSSSVYVVFTEVFVDVVGSGLGFGGIKMENSFLNSSSTDLSNGLCALNCNCACFSGFLFVSGFNN